MRTKHIKKSHIVRIIIKSESILSKIHLEAYYQSVEMNYISRAVKMGSGPWASPAHCGLEVDQAQFF